MHSGGVQFLDSARNRAERFFWVTGFIPRAEKYEMDAPLRATRAHPLRRLGTSLPTDRGTCIDPGWQRARVAP